MATVATNMLIRHTTITQVLSSGTIKLIFADCDQWSTALTRRRTYLATSPGDLGAVSLLRWHDLLVNDSYQAQRWLIVIAALPADFCYISYKTRP